MWMIALILLVLLVECILTINVESKENKTFYQKELKRLCSQLTNDKLIIGDSRLLSLTLDGFDNISIGGMTAATALENQHLFLKSQ